MKVNSIDDEARDSSAVPAAVLCADEESLKHPQLLGLDDVVLESYSWLKTITSASEARALVKQLQGLEEVWISSTDEMSALNLAAALRKDRQDLAIMLIAFSPTGSFLSNAAALGVNEVLTETTFPAHFSKMCSSGGKAISKNRKSPRIKAEELPDIKVSELSSTKGEMQPDAKGGELSSTKDGELTGVKSGAIEGVEIDSSSGLLLPVVSGSGGSGKSTVVAVLSTLLAELDMSVMVLDLDLQFGDMHRLLGCKSSMSINDALADPSALDVLKSRSNAESSLYSPSLIAAPPRLEQADLVYNHIGEVLDMCTSRFDAVVVNTSSAWGESQALLLERSISPIFLIDQKASSVFACKHALDLCTRMGIATRSFVFALNRCSKDAMFTGIDVAIALQGAHVVEIGDGGHEVEELLGAGMPGELCSMRNEMVKGVKSILDELINVNPEMHSKKKGISGSLRSNSLVRARSSRRRKAKSDDTASALDFSIETKDAEAQVAPGLTVGR